MEFILICFQKSFKSIINLKQNHSLECLNDDKIVLPFYIKNIILLFHDSSKILTSIQEKNKNK
jgi:hypothetical protein